MAIQNTDCEDVNAISHLINAYLRMKESTNVSLKIQNDFADWLDQYLIEIDDSNKDNLLPRK